MGQVQVLRSSPGGWQKGRHAVHGTYRRLFTLIFVPTYSTLWDDKETARTLPLGLKYAREDKASSVNSTCVTVY